MMQMIDQLRNRIRLLVGRAIIGAVHSAGSDNGLSIDVSLAGGEQHTDVPLMQHYGLSAKPRKDAEAVIIFLGGARDNGIAIATQGKTSSLPSLNDGEVALYSEFGQTIILKKDGSVSVTPKSGKGISLNSDVVISGDLSVSKGISASDDVTAGTISLKMHTHVVPGVTSGSSSTTSNIPQ